MYWKQYKMQISNAGHNTSDTWYLVSEAKIAEANTPRWLITNTNLAQLLLISANNLASYSSICPTTNCVRHDDAPVHFVSEEGKPIKRTRQLLWTLEGVDFIINKSGIRLIDSVKNSMRVWLKAQAETYGVYTSNESLPSEQEVTKASLIKSIGEAKHNIVEAVNYVTDIVNQLWSERNKRRELEEEVTRLKTQISNISSVSKPTVLNFDSSHISKTNSSKAMGNLDSMRAVYHKNVVTGPTHISLGQYLSTKGNPNKAEQLTRLGLINSDQVYGLFSEFWKDNDGKLINKGKFQDILRAEFHTINTTHRTPCLKSEVLRENLAIVCQVYCKKKPNPKDTAGNIMEEDNPAYTASSQPCVRFQARYTSKAIDYLRANWYKLRNGPAQPVTA